MKYSIYSLILSAIVLALLTACGGDNAAEQAAPAEAEAVAAEAEEEVAEAMSGDPATGAELYSKSCVACHGPNGEGVEGLGRDMTASEFIAERSNVELVEFIKTGRDPSDPLNTTGVAMPPKGGNPALSDADLQDIVAHIRTLQE